MAKIDTPITANDQSLERVLNTPQDKLLVIYNSRHGGLSSAIQDRMKTLAKSVLVVKIDTVENPRAASTFKAGLVAYQADQEIARHPTLDVSVLSHYADYLLGNITELKENSPMTDHIKVTPIHVNEASFAQDVLQADHPVLVDFWAEWCGPCHMIAPSLEKFASEFAGQLTVAKLNVDENQSLAMQYRIHGIPALKIFNGGKVVDELVGAAPEPMLRQFIERNL